jgi:hypothetical protein
MNIMMLHRDINDVRRSKSCESVACKIESKKKERFILFRRMNASLQDSMSRRIQMKGTIAITSIVAILFVADVTQHIAAQTNQPEWATRS